MALRWRVMSRSISSLCMLALHSWLARTDMAAGHTEWGERRAALKYGKTSGFSRGLAKLKAAHRPHSLLRSPSTKLPMDTAALDSFLGEAGALSGSTASCVLHIEVSKA